MRVLLGLFVCLPSIMYSTHAIPMGGLDLPKELVMDVNKPYLIHSKSVSKKIYAGYLLCYRPYPVVNIIVDEPVDASMTASASGFLRHRGHGRTKTLRTSADVEEKATQAERMAQNMLLKKLAFIRVEPNRELGHKGTVNKCHLCKQTVANLYGFGYEWVR